MEKVEWRSQLSVIFNDSGVSKGRIELVETKILILPLLRTFQIINYLAAKTVLEWSA